jgi:hypothetical protein
MKVGLAVSCFNGDQSARVLIEQARSQGLRDSFAAMAIVDSGDPERCRSLKASLERFEPPVHYEAHGGNLGSAGNLVARLRWGQQQGLDVLVAVNADGLLHAANIATMIELAERSGAGAVYPTHLLPDGRVDLTVRRPVPVLPDRRPASRLSGHSAIRVGWGSSNGALYRLSAIESLDLDRVSSLWYGWEDLAIGLGLRVAGVEQLMSIASAQLTTADQKTLASTRVVVSDKMPWTTYYGVRNLVLISSWYPEHGRAFSARLAREFAVILTRDRRKARYRFAVEGLRDGRSGVTGMCVDPLRPSAEREQA